MLQLFSLHELTTKMVLDVNFFSYELKDAQAFQSQLKKIFQTHHIYITKEFARYYIRGILLNPLNGFIYSDNALTQLADYFNCGSVLHEPEYRIAS